MTDLPRVDQKAVFLLVAATLVTGAIGGVTTPAAGQQAAGPVSVSTNYDETTPDQLIRVTLQIEARETTLSNIRVSTSSSDQTVIEPSSFTTQVSPGTRDIPVKPKPNGRFLIDELNPGEQVTITFAIVPVSFEKSSISAATFRLRYVRYGQQLQATKQVSADLSQNPWALLQNARQQINSLETSLDQRRLGFVGGIATGIVGLLVGSIAELRRRRSLAQSQEQLKDILSDAGRDLPPSERPVIERVMRRVGIDPPQLTSVETERSTATATATASASGSSPDATSSVTQTTQDSSAGDPVDGSTTERSGESDYDPEKLV